MRSLYTSSSVSSSSLHILSSSSLHILSSSSLHILLSSSLHILWTLLNDSALSIELFAFYDNVIVTAYSWHTSYILIALSWHTNKVRLVEAVEKELLVGRWMRTKSPEAHRATHSPQLGVCLRTLLRLSLCLYGILCFWSMVCGYGYHLILSLDRGNPEHILSFLSQHLFFTFAF